MTITRTIKRGRNFLLTPGPSNVPQSVLQAMARNAVDLSNPEFTAFTRQCIDDLKAIFKTQGQTFIYTANGHGAWEAALVNTLSPGDKILVAGAGHFAESWAAMANALHYETQLIPSDWRHAADPNLIEDYLRQDTEQQIKALLFVHTDTATGISNDLVTARQAIDNAKHDALFMVDAVASLGTTDFCMDDWQIDVAVSASQKGLMTPPGLSFVAASEKALQINKQTSTGRYYWSWQQRMEEEWYRWFCGTSPEHLLFGLRVAIDMLFEEGLEQVFARHQRLADATRAAVQTWSEQGVVGLNTLQPEYAANSVTSIRLAEGYDANKVKALCNELFNVSPGGGLGQLNGKVFRISHMGDINEATILGALGSVEAVFKLCNIPHGKGGVNAAIDSLLASFKHT